MPNRPITATRKLTPRSRWSIRRSCAVGPTRCPCRAGSSRPSDIDDDGLVFFLASESDEGAEGEEVDGEEFRRTEAQCEVGDTRREERDEDHRDQRTDEGGR